MQFNQISVFMQRGKSKNPEKNLLGERTNKLNPHMTLSLGIESRPLWWKASNCSHQCTLPAPQAVLKATVGHQASVVESFDRCGEGGKVWQGKVIRLMVNGSGLIGKNRNAGNWSLGGFFSFRSWDSRSVGRNADLCSHWKCHNPPEGA